LKDVCGFYELLEENEQYLVDKGFQDSLGGMLRGNKGLAPSRFHNGYQYAKRNIKKSMTTSRFRVQIEQMIGRNAMFNFFVLPVQHKHQKIVGTAYVMVGFLQNICSPIAWRKGKRIKTDSSPYRRLLRAKEQLGYLFIIFILFCLLL